MENNGWIKLHRKILQNDSLFRAGSTFPLWCLLLLLADRNGIVRSGRFQLSHWLKLKPMTVYKAIKRLQSLNMVETKSNNKVTVIMILNWGVYQQKSNNEVNEVEQQSNTPLIYTRIKNKNKETRISNKEEKENYNPSLEVLEDISEKYGVPLTFVRFQLETLQNYIASSGKVYKDPTAALRNFVLRDMKKVLEKNKLNGGNYGFTDASKL